MVIKINRLQKYFFNGLLLSAAAIAMRTVAVGFNVYVSSRLGAEGMGLLNLTSSVYGFAITLATSGINLAVVRLVSSALPYENDSYFDKKADRRVKKIMTNALLYCLFFSLLASLILFTGSDNICVYILGDKRAALSLKILSFTLLPISLSSALNGYFCAVRRVYKNVIVQLLEQGVKIFVVSSLLLLIAPNGVEHACSSVIVGGAISEAFSLIISALLYFFDRRIHKKNDCDFPEKADTCRGFYIKKPKNVKKESVFGVAFPVAVGAYARSALLTIEHLAIPWGLKMSGSSSANALASYGILHGMVFPLLLFPSSVLGAFSSLLVPELSSAKEQGDYKRISSIVSRVFYFSLLFSVGVAGIFVCFSHEIGAFVYSSQEAGDFIRMLSPLIPLMYLDGAVDSMLKGLGEQMYTMRVNILDSLISVLLILALLPAFGVEGYITVIFLMELFNTSFSILRLLNVTKLKTPVFKWVIKPLLSIVFSTVISRIIFSIDSVYSFLVFYIDNKYITFFEIFVSLALYLAFAKISGSVSKKDFYFAKGLFGKA